MLKSLTRLWWVPLTQGLIAMLFGIVAFVYPVPSLTTLVLLFGAWVFVDGLFALTDGFLRRRYARDWPFTLILGFIGVGIGGFTFWAPEITGQVLLVTIAAWAVLKGMVEIAMALVLRRVFRGAWWLGLAGVVSIVLGLLLLMNPAPGAIALLWLIAVLVLVLGAMLFAFGLWLRRLDKSVDHDDGFVMASTR